MRLSYSAIRTYQECPRKYWYTYVRGLVPAKRQLALEFGQAWHQAMEVWHESRLLEPAIRAFNAAYQDEPGETLRTQAVAKRLLSLYATRYAQEVFQVLESERFFSFTQGGYEYAIKVDKLVSWDGIPVAVEHKTTTSYLGASFIRQFKPNLQLAGYVAGLRRMGYPTLERVLVDAVYLGRTAPRDGEPVLRYEEKIGAWELAEWETIVRQVGTALSQQGEDYAAYTPNWNACAQYGGCPFQRLCMSPPEIRDTLARVEYQTTREVVDGSA